MNNKQNTNTMQERIYPTPQGDIHYWCTPFDSGKRTLIFLPGLTADHLLFEKQTEAFAPDCNVLAWDAPGHAASRPFALTFSMIQKATWLKAIIDEYTNNTSAPILIGQSMGGYVAQEYVSLFPDRVAGVVCIDSAPLEKQYVTGIELWLLRHTKPVYKMFPWGLLQKAAVTGCADTSYGRETMRKMLLSYSHAYYCELAAHGYEMLADAMERHTEPILHDRVLLLVGEHDKAGSCLRYNRAWSKRAHLPLVYVPNAGHNSNTDNPDFVNLRIREFMDSARLLTI